MGRLEGKVAIITGAAQGMGAAAARAFISNGAKVIMTDIKAEKGAALASELGEYAIFIEHDVSSSADWKTVVELGENTFGSITTLVNNAGIVGVVEGTVELKEEDYHRISATNQTSVFLGMQAVLPTMLENGGGSIINNSSIAGMSAVVGCPNLAYVSSKFAVRGMTKHVAVEYGDKNIRVNSIHPGLIETDMGHLVFEDFVEIGMAENLAEAQETALGMIPMARLGAAEEVAKMTRFLASDDAAYVTGAEFVVDGGMTAT